MAPSKPRHYEIYDIIYFKMNRIYGDLEEHHMGFLREIVPWDLQNRRSFVRDHLEQFEWLLSNVPEFGINFRGDRVVLFLTKDQLLRYKLSV